MISVMNLTDEDRAGLESLLRREGYDGSVSARAQIVLWRAEGHSAPKIARTAGTTKPTVYKWIARYEQQGIDGLSDRVSTDPGFEEKVVDVVGLCLDPPMDAVVLSIDEKTQVQALDRTQPLLPMTFSKTEKR